MQGSHTSKVLQTKCGKTGTSGEGAVPNIPSAPARVKTGNFMKKILEYIKSVRSEWFKIVWPSRDTVIRSTIMILVFSGLATVFFFVVDSVLNAIVGWIF